MTPDGTLLLTQEEVANLISREDVGPGTFIAAVGADSQEKQELDPYLFAASTIVVDSLDQSSTIGDLHHALRLGIVRKESAHAERNNVGVRVKFA